MLLIRHAYFSLKDSDQNKKKNANKYKKQLKTEEWLGQKVNKKE